MTMIVVDGAAQRAAWRAGATVYTAAMSKALDRITIAPGVTLLDAAEALVETLPKDAQIAWHKVQQFERDNPDVQKWAPNLISSLKPGATEEETAAIIDAVFVLAIAIERQSEPATEAAHAALLALLT